MSVPERIADVVTGRSRIVLVVLLLATALVGAGAPMVDDDSSLEQFETDSPEAEALEDIEDRFGTDDDENTTSVQLITRGENVLTQESLIESLEFQQEIRDNESINETLVDEEAITGVENLVAMTAETNEEIEALEERGDDLEERGEELEERADELEERGEELGEREAELNATSAQLETGIDEARDLQREYEELSAEYDEDDPEYQEGTAELEAEYDALLEEVTAGLDDEQAAEYEELAGQAQEIESQLFEIEQTTDDPEDVPEYQELNEQLEGIYTGATMGVLEDEYEQLEDDSAELADDQEQLEDEFDELEADQERLEDDWTELEEDDERPSVDEQIEILEGLDDDEFEDALEDTLSDDDGGAGLAFMPSEYDPGSTEADARMTAVSQDAGEEGLEMGAGDDAVIEAQLDLRDLASAHDHDQIVFGAGIITDEIDRSMGDSLAIVGPLALAFVVAALLIAYRDPLDIVLGVTGIVAVLIWTFGFMGWADIAFNQMFVAVPVLLIGLSIDYAIHVFMRHREQRQDRSDADGDSAGLATRNGVRGSMAIALAGVGVALVWVTATTAIGFLANLVSPIGPIQEFGVVSAVGILSALIVFGGLIPAAKVEIDAFLESRGFDRHRRAFGTGGGRLASVLTIGSGAARRIPIVLLVAVLLLTAGGVYGASQIDTSFEEEDFLAESPPDWTNSLPGPMAPGEYQAADNLDYVNENFQRDDLQVQLLVEGPVAENGTLERLEAAQDEAAESDVVYTLPDGEADVEGPISVMEETAAQNESFNESFTDADTTGNDVPDQNVEELYDELFDVNEDAARDVIHRTDDGEYDSVRLLVATQGDADFDETTTEMRDIAATIDDGDVGDDREHEDDGLVAIATGDPIVNYIVEQDLFDTVLQSLMVTLVAVFTFLTGAYWLTGNSATLGAVTLLPVAFATSWILGTMYLIGMPFNVLTGMITSLTIGLGVAYSIHISARYTLELERQGNVWSALHTTVTGTGGALLGSAATTIGGFGTLAFAILPVLRQFGIITGLTIAYAFLASVVVLPTLLVLWTRYFGPDVSFARQRTRPPATTASDGGTPEVTGEPGDTPETDDTDRIDNEGDRR
ncbi:MMPL family transporter [Natronobacterium texcoconense]|uniref:Predicted exporter protein, RND superfamily n=1 Tax=Natronobacterium texcoconense TaxID=1095778 RepID=A0A1H1GTW0_NATTX|nr:MMPL family transporter [Natronobacterium texcoconense]SDR16581.1 Predicted exporter protein, RND superfamily [Natronobacterium texcoconense]